MMLVIYGVKCGVPEQQVKKDALALIPEFTAIKPEDPFTKDDVRSAMDCYDDRYATFPIRDISKLSGIQIPRNKRNGRTQVAHCKLMRLIRDEINGHKDTWMNKDGRPQKKEIVAAWREKNPSGRKIDCERETGLSRHTVLKWWNG